MAISGLDERNRTSSEFVDDTVLEAFVPASSQVNLQELLESWDGEIPEESNSIVPCIEQRRFLFLDELVSVYVVLRTKVLEESALETYLSRLAITLEARAVGTLIAMPMEGHNVSQPTQANEVLYSEIIEDVEEPTILATEVQSDDGNEPSQFLYVFWKVTVPLGRPKLKIQKLSIYFAPSASLKPTDAAKSSSFNDEYMPSRVPQPINLLQPFANDPAFGDLAPKLSALRITRARPATSTSKQLLRPLRSGPRRLFRAAPAFLWRIRFATSASSLQPNVTIASLDLEVTPFAGSDILFKKMEVKVTSGRVDALGPSLPFRAQPGDQITLLYRITPLSTEDSSSTSAQPQNLTIDASSSVLASKSCTPEIAFSWSTPVDLSASRPNSRAGTSRVPPKPLGPDSLPMIDQITAPDAYTTMTKGVCFTITGCLGVRVGEIFKWDLFVFNRSDKVHRLAVLAVTKRRVLSGEQKLRDSMSSLAGPMPEKDRHTLAEPVISDQAVFASQRGAVQPAELICLSPDVRIGPLAPSACFKTELRFVALTSGVLYLDCLRVIDLNSQETTDIVDVPDITATE